MPDGPWSLWIPGKPVTWKRSATGGFWVGRGRGRKWIRATDPADQIWRNTVRHAWFTAHGSLGLAGPLVLTVRVFGSTGDVDNSVKGVMDALQWYPEDGQAPGYLNDRQIWRLVVERYPAQKTSGGTVSGVWIGLQSRPPRRNIVRWLGRLLGRSAAA